MLPYLAVAIASPYLMPSRGREGIIMGRDWKPARNAWKAPLAALALCAVLTLPSDASANKVGVAAAVQPDAFSGGKQIKIGKSIFYNERINTNSEGLVQVLLVDGSTFTVGPGSDLVIDKFVYDPSKDQGEIAASFSKGVVRFVGGKISKNPDSVTVKTPAGALAIRGGMFQGAINSNGTIFSFLYGDQMVLTGTNGRVHRVYQPGYTLDLTGGAPRIRPTTAADTQMIMQSLRGRGRAVAGGQGGNGNGEGGDGTGGNSQNQRARNNSLDPFQNVETIVTDATTTIINQQIQDQLNKDNTPPPTPPDGPPTPEPPESPNYYGFAGGVMYSDEPQSGFSSVVLSESLADFRFTQNDDGSGVGRLVLRDTLGEDPAVNRYEFDFASEGDFAYAPTQVIVYDNNGQPYAENFATTSVAQGQGFCNDCNFMKWGAVTGSVAFGSTGDPDQYIDEFTPAFWIASNKLTSPVQLDNLQAQGATAQYAGGVIGSVVNYSQQGVDRYSTVGTFDMDWSFAQRSGQMNMNFDGRQFGGPMNQVGQQNMFTGNLADQSTVPTLTGTAHGAFANRNGIPAGGLIGNWGVRSPNYRAGGIFAGTGTPIPGQ
ncbi:MAG: FecR family protein [Methyloligella sp. ZOD6]